MKIVITSTGSSWDSQVDPRFGRAKYFFIYDEDKESIEILDNNKNVQAAHGAGISSAQNVVDSGVEAVLTGRVGPKAQHVLDSANIKIVGGADGKTLRQAYDAFKAGELN